MTIETAQLVGPCTGIPGHNYQAFNEAAIILRNNGILVRNPAELAIEFQREHDREPTWAECMRLCLVSLTDGHVNAIIRLHGWQESRGANLEVQVANAIGLECYEWESMRIHFEKQIRPYEDNLQYVKIL